MDTGWRSGGDGYRLETGGRWTQAGDREVMDTGWRSGGDGYRLEIGRYPYRMLSVIGTDLYTLSWIHHCLWIPVLPSILLTEVIAIYQSLPYFEALGTYSFQLPGPIAVPIHFPYVLQLYCLILVIGTYCSCRHFYEERKLNTRYIKKLKQN
ncbi:hypothetical protein chiPu_0001828 [Chiloscyllium punctatum]|uniref:Very-long-chain (3R)-3-hydroxyacyl-CoA dehydratase n=1 Tax=Chiloscyllium punctatum TaxID=137246 RepID=A0A401RZ52_CHIPU|nr:hypothetical protein [Chiloscyllium punctatum]